MRNKLEKKPEEYIRAKAAREEWKPVWGCGGYGR